MFLWPGALWGPLNRPHYLPSLLALILPQPLPGHASKLPFFEHFFSSPCFKETMESLGGSKRLFTIKPQIAFLFQLCFHFLILSIAQDHLWPLECSIFSQLHTLMIQAILSATSLLLVQKSPLKLLWEPSSLNQMIVNFIIPNTSKHSSHSLNISVIFYNLFPHIDKKNLSELRS